MLRQAPGGEGAVAPPGEASGALGVGTVYSLKSARERGFLPHRVRSARNSRYRTRIGKRSQ